MTNRYAQSRYGLMREVGRKKVYNAGDVLRWLGY